MLVLSSFCGSKPNTNVVQGQIAALLQDHLHRCHRKRCPSRHDSAKANPHNCTGRPGVQDPRRAPAARPAPSDLDLPLGDCDRNGLFAGGGTKLFACIAQIKINRHRRQCKLARNALAPVAARHQRKAIRLAP